MSAVLLLSLVLEPPRGALDVPDPNDGAAGETDYRARRCVSNVESLDDVVPLLEQLGRDHRRFAVVTEHYSAVGASLLATLKRSLAHRGPPSWPTHGRRLTESSRRSWLPLLSNTRMSRPLGGKPMWCESSDARSKLP